MVMELESLSSETLNIANGIFTLFESEIEIENFVMVLGMGCEHIS